MIEILRSDDQEVQGEERALLDGQQGPQLHDDHWLLADRSSLPHDDFHSFHDCHNFKDLYDYHNSLILDYRSWPGLSRSSLDSGVKLT